MDEKVKYIDSSNTAEMILNTFHIIIFLNIVIRSNIEITYL